MDPERGRDRPYLTAPASEDGSEPRLRARRVLALMTATSWHVSSLVVGALFLFYVNRDQWFFGDEWDFLTDRVVTLGDRGVLEPHNEHWSTTPILIYGLLFRLVALGSYTPYVAVLIVAHLAVVHLVWRVMRRGGVEPWISTVACAAFIPYGPGADNLLWAFQIGFVGSVALGLGAILVADRSGAFGRQEALAGALSVLGLTFSAIAVPLAAATAVLSWMRRGFRAFLLAGSLPAAAYVLWALTAGGSSVPGGLATTDIAGYFRFLWRSLVATLSLGTSTPLTGALPLALTAVAVGLRRRRGRSFPLAPFAAALGWMFLLLILALGRASFGSEIADATRYMYIGGALLLPLLVLGISDFGGRGILGGLLVAALVGAWGVHNGKLLIERAEHQSERERLIREQIAAAGTLFRSSTVLGLHPDPVKTPDLLLAELDVLLPDILRGVEPSAEAVLRAALALQSSLTSVPEFETTIALADIRAFEADLIPRDAGCVEARPEGRKARFLLPTGPASSIALSASSPTELELRASARGVRPDYGLDLLVPARGAVYLNVAVDEGLVGEGSVIARFTQPLDLCTVDARTPEP